MDPCQKRWRNEGDSFVGDRDSLITKCPVTLHGEPAGDGWLVRSNFKTQQRS
jgi:hypothetical protein